jgi:hypothetical protein
MKEILEKRLKYADSVLKSSLSTFLNTNKRVDRDKVIKIRTKIEVYEELLKEIK